MDFHLEGNPYVPVDLGIANGVPQTLLAGTSGTSRATLDTGSPVSLLASEAGCDPATPLRVLGTLPPSPTRLVFADLHPACATGGLSLLGGDVLARYEVLFEHDSQTVAGGTCTMSAAGIELLPSEIESTTELGADGFSVISFHRTGGGKYVDVTGRTIEYVPTRAPLRVCINPPTDYHTAGGVDATLLVATAGKPASTTARATHPHS